MALSWNEIKDRALRFSKEWAGTTSEDAEAKSFLDAFFEVFDVKRKKVGTFEHKVKKLNEADGYIDLLWKGVILIEMKSAGKDLGKAFEQAKAYVQGLQPAEVPKYILVCDFNIFRLYDTEEQTTVEFKLADFVKNVQHFGLVAGYQKRVYKEQDPVNIKAAELLGKLHDRLEEIGYTGHALEVLLVRLLFCLFAEDTTIFEKLQFQAFIEQKTATDGSDLASKLQELFQVLNTPAEKRFKNLDEDLAKFEYVNGKLFEETLPIASFDSKMRQALLDCCNLDWSRISPAIFGSMFQSVMKPAERRNLGAHYTSEKNILKLIKPLFLDELWAEFEKCKRSTAATKTFHKKLAELTFLDPACGCGNFLVIAYRELRLLELEVLKVLHKNQQVLNVSDIIWLDVDMMYGIEYEEFPARIAEVAMWLIDHQMNSLISNEFGRYFKRIPLKKSANIVNGNSLRLDWENIVPKAKLSFIMGNPPFVGKKVRSSEQQADMDLVFGESDGTGVLDYVAAWYVKAARFIQGRNIDCAFVSTSSIVQGEQVALLWHLLLSQFNICINFAHRTFKWGNEAKNNAAVHVVIIGFAASDKATKFLYEYDDFNSEPHELKVKNISPYLVESKNLLIDKRSAPISKVPEISFGSMPNDGGFFLFTDEEKNQFLKSEPKAKKFFRRLLSNDEYLYNINRWCLWLKDADPGEIKQLPEIMKRVEAVRKLRNESKRAATQKLASFPTLFGEDRQPKSEFILIPLHSSENRKYIPMGFFAPTNIPNNSCSIIEGATFFHFGILHSQMHMAWVRSICGRLESRFRYSNTIVYNNFPWPDDPSEKQIKSIESAAKKIIDVRAEFPDSSPADLYDPRSMPPKLVKAHNDLDKAVDLAYRPYPFPSDAKRLEWLFDLYDKYTAGLFKDEKTTAKRKTAKSK